MIKNWCLVIRAQGDHTDQARLIYCFNTLVFTPIPQDSKPRWLWLIPGLHVHFTRHLVHVFMFFLVASFQYFFRYGTCVCTLIKISGSGSTSKYLLILVQLIRFLKFIQRIDLLSLDEVFLNKSVLLIWNKIIERKSMIGTHSIRLLRLRKCHWNIFAWNQIKVDSSLTDFSFICLCVFYHVWIGNSSKWNDN